MSPLSLQQLYGKQTRDCFHKLLCFLFCILCREHLPIVFTSSRYQLCHKGKIDKFSDLWFLFWYKLISGTSSIAGGNLSIFNLSYPSEWVERCLLLTAIRWPVYGHNCWVLIAELVVCLTSIFGGLGEVNPAPTTRKTKKTIRWQVNIMHTVRAGTVAPSCTLLVMFLKVLWFY